jgi:hypothetical protein
LRRTTDQPSEIFLRLADELFQSTGELIFVHLKFLKVK